MIKHIVLWKLDDSYSDAEKEAVKNALRKKLLDLKDEIEVLIHIEVYLNSPEASPNNYDILLDTIFNSLEDLATYQAHPSHQKVGKNISIHLSISVQPSTIVTETKYRLIKNQFSGEYCCHSRTTECW